MEAPDPEDPLRARRIDWAGRLKLLQHHSERLTPDRCRRTILGTMRQQRPAKQLAQSAVLLLALGSFAGCWELPNIEVTDGPVTTDSAMDLVVPVVDFGTDVAMASDDIWMSECDKEAYRRSWSTCSDAGEKFQCSGTEFDFRCVCAQSYELLHWFCYSHRGYHCDPRPYELVSYAGNPCEVCEIGHTFSCSGAWENMACCTCSAEKVGPRWRCTYNQQCSPTPEENVGRCEVDLAAPLDQGVRDLPNPTDLRVPPDLARPPDLAAPRDLGPPADAARDLAARG